MAHLISSTAPIVLHAIRQGLFTAVQLSIEDSPPMEAAGAHRPIRPDRTF